MIESTSNLPWLTLLILTPALGAVFIALRGALFAADQPSERQNDDQQGQFARVLALAFGLATFGLSVLIYFMYNPQLGGFQLVEETDWLGGGIGYKVGIDGISVLFILLTTFIMPVAILASWNSVKSRVPEIMMAFLILETLILGVFASLDMFVFYLFFEGSLIPMFLIIGIWGSSGEKVFAGIRMPSRVYAALKFFLFTLLGSLLMLIAMAWMYAKAGTTDIVELQNFAFPAGAQKWLWLAFFASFAVKMPMWPVHTWLPDAHVQAPTGGSVVLAAILLKMGGYGFLRFSLPMFPIASLDFAPLVYAMSVIAIIYTSLVALVQEDMKKLIAYSSVAHMGFVTMGIFTATKQGIEGGLFQMLSHGFISGALFLCVGVVYDRMHTREIAAFGGLVHRMPLYAFMFLFFTMGNVGLPGTSGFVGEILSMTGAFKVNSWIAFFAAFGVIFSAAYALRLYRLVVYGPLEKEGLKSISDVGYLEMSLLGVLMIFTLILGFNPTPALDVFSPSVDLIIQNYEAAIAAGGQ